MNFWIFIFLFALAAIMFFLKAFLLAEMRQGNSATTHKLDEPAGQAQRLRPAELAYLASSGDMTQTMIVLVVDLIQRAAKGATGSADTSIAPYEQKIFMRVKEDLEGWTHGQVEKIMPPAVKEKPLEFMQFIFRCYQFFTKSLRQFLQKTISDPKHLRKYFSPKALFYVVADLFSSGYQPIVEAEISAYLKRQGLLIDSHRLNEYARILFVVSFVASIAVLATTILLTHDVALSVIAWFSAGFNACCLRAIWYLRSFIPLYDELSDVTKHLQKANWRVAAAKGMVRLVSTLAVVAIAFVSAIALALESALMFLIHHSWNLPTTMEGNLPIAVVIVSMTFASLVILDSALEGYFLTAKPQASASGMNLMNKYKRDLTNASPFESFKEMLASADYSADFGNILAVYGLGTLWILL